MIYTKMYYKEKAFMTMFVTRQGKTNSDLASHVG